MELTIDGQAWSYDRQEEFWAELPRSSEYCIDNIAGGNRFILSFSGSDSTSVNVTLSTRQDIETLLEFVSSQYAEPSEEPHSRPLSKKKYYYSTTFPIDTVRRTWTLFVGHITALGNPGFPTTLSVTSDNETWSFSNVEEFFAEIGPAEDYLMSHYRHGCGFMFHKHFKKYSEIEITLPTRAAIQGIFSVLDECADASKIQQEKASLSIFIGHGGDPQWRDLKDHLQDSHGLSVTAYEIGPRAGMSVKDVLESMLKETSFALLVLTGEDLHADGERHARENVIHELGLFQAKLGFTRAIALLEDGVPEFSNILGINQVRFPRGGIRNTYGDVIALIKREFQE